MPESQQNPTPVSELTTPCLLLDERRMTDNILSMRRRIPAGVIFRPHLKTAKSIDVARRQMASPTGPATVSTLKEAEYFASAGVTDLLYAVGLTPDKLERVIELRDRGIDLSVVVDNISAAHSLAERSKRLEQPIPVLIEIDCDGTRAGLSIEAPAPLLELGKVLKNGCDVRGVMTHAGASYNCRTLADIESMAEHERSVAVRGAKILREAGIACPVVSVGSTPTALFCKDFTDITEVRAGVFVFFDLVMAGLGVCRVDNIALSVLTTVIGVRARDASIIVDAGWMAMSRDRGTSGQPVDQLYGVVCDVNGQSYEDLLMLEANQEHGILGLRPGSRAKVPPLKVGDRVRILPNHACATGAQHDVYHVVNGMPPLETAQWPRVRGW